MSTIRARYDAAAERYGTWWGPVLAPTGARLLDRIALPAMDDVRILDLGTGTGQLAIEALRRWPAARVVGIDASTGMLEVAADRADRELPAASRRRLELVAADAARLPVPDASFDVVLSSFVLQLVADRFAVMREARRVLRPGGRLATVTWLAGQPDERFAPDEAFEAALDDLDVGDDLDEEEPRSGDFASPEAAAAQLRRAGFRDVRAEVVELVHAYDPATYVDFLEQYAESETFEDLEPELQRRLRDRTTVRLARLRPEAFVWRVPVVELGGRRP